MVEKMTLEKLAVMVQTGFLEQNDKFAKIDERFDRIDRWFDRFEKKTARIYKSYQSN